MGELLPIVGGAIVALAVFRARPRGARWPWLTAGGVVVGVLASAVNGELEVSAGFLIVDVPLALLAAAATVRVLDLAQARAPEDP